MRELKINSIEIEIDNINYYISFKKNSIGAYWCDCPEEMPIPLAKYLEEVGIKAKEIIEDWKKENENI